MPKGFFKKGGPRFIAPPAAGSGTLVGQYDELSTLTLSGSNVTAWSDRSGRGNHVTQADANKYPTWTTWANGVEFTGGAAANIDQLTLADCADFSFGTGDFVVAMLVKHTDGSSGHAPVGKDNWNTSLVGWFCQVYPAVDRFRFATRNGAGNQNYIDSAVTTYTNNAWQQIIVYRKSNVLYGLNAGTQILTGAESSACNVDSAALFRIGNSEGASANIGWIGGIKRVVVYKGTTADSTFLTSLNNYLAQASP